MRNNWIIKMPLLLAAVGLFTAGCEQSGQTSTPSATETASASDSSDGTVKAQPPSAPEAVGTSDSNDGNGKVQTPPPPITLDVVDYEGYEQLIKQHRGKVVFVDMWATW